MSETVDNVDPVESLKTKTGIVRETNAGLVSEIEQMGGGVEVSIARIEHFIQFLADEGHITAYDQWREQMQWEMGLKHQLVSVRDRLREMIANGPPPAQPRPRTPVKKLWVPGK